MKSKRTFISMLLLCCLLALTAGSGQAQGPGPLGDVDIQTKLDSTALAALGTSFTYQGQLKKDGNPVNVNCDFQFSLWDASSGGAQIGSAQTKANVAVSNGLFTTSLDFGSVFTGNARWLAIAVRCPAGSGSYTTLSPRQALTAAPYALGLRPGANVTGDISGSILIVRNTAAGVFSTGMYGQSDSTAGSGVYGYASAASGAAYGVKGFSNSPAGTGVYGLSNTSGTGVFGVSSTGDGVRGQSGGANKSGVYGVNTGSGFGVYGESVGSGGAGVYAIGSWRGVVGYATATSGANIGVYGESASSGGVGVYATASWRGVVGYATATSGANIGVYGESASTSGTGVYGVNTSSGTGVTGSSSTGDGVRGQSSGANKSGVYGVNTGSGFGVYGSSSSGYAGGFRGNVAVFSRATGAAILELGEGLDYAEGFDVSDQGEILPGTVLVIDPDQPGKLTVSNTPYDRKVAGIVTGAKGLGSGVRLGVDQFDYDVALAGRVYCNVDATYGEVSPGDLLTTSPTPGYAMVVKDYGKAQGAILGKAMEGLPAGERGQILVLVTLQ